MSLSTRRRSATNSGTKHQPQDEFCSWVQSHEEPAYVHNDREDALDFAQFAQRSLQQRSARAFTMTDQMGSHSDALMAKRVRKQLSQCELSLHDFTAPGSAEALLAKVDDSQPDGEVNALGLRCELLQMLFKGFGVTVPMDSIKSPKAASLFASSPRSSPHENLIADTAGTQSKLVWHVPVSPMTVVMDDTLGGCLGGGDNVTGPDSVSGASSSYSISTFSSTDPANEQKLIVSSSKRAVPGGSSKATNTPSASAFVRRATSTLEEQCVPARDLARGIDARERVRSSVCSVNSFTDTGTCMDWMHVVVVVCLVYGFGCQFSFAPVPCT